MGRMLLTAAFLWAFVVGTTRADLEIVPGERIGKVRIGMEHAEVMLLLGAPHHEEDLETTQRDGRFMPDYKTMPILKGVLQDDWITPVPIPKGADAGDPEFMCDFVTVYFRNRLVVQ